ncbi:hypothetical protein HanPSC8_Chr05g0213911 [Helianthus annuus]|nr:hypothetical protein HanPSC8_Chr05g0213911 [Helianthus annuus]
MECSSVEDYCDLNKKEVKSTLDRNEVPIAAKQSEPARWFVGGGSVRKLVSPARECGTKQSVYMSFRV